MMMMIDDTDDWWEMMMIDGVDNWRQWRWCQLMIDNFDDNDDW